MYTTTNYNKNIYYCHYYLSLSLYIYIYIYAYLFALADPLKDLLPCGSESITGFLEVHARLVDM